ncbi:MAG TPA: hypothetical protein VJV05_02800, partial [Pyrinomonadaceae bacterium]|nr:hypothetical protein [Pyrinomonadaceae bacterium]
MKLLNYSVVQNISCQISWKKKLRRVFAVAFLLFLIIEWGSHNLAFAHTYSETGRAVQSQDSGHDDPCKTMIRCSDGPRQDQTLKLTHDVLQYNNVFNASLSPRQWADLHQDPRLRRPLLYPLFRPPDP